MTAGKQRPRSAAASTRSTAALNAAGGVEAALAGVEPGCPAPPASPGPRRPGRGAVTGSAAVRGVDRAATGIAPSKATPTSPAASAQLAAGGGELTPAARARRRRAELESGLGQLTTARASCRAASPAAPAPRAGSPRARDARASVAKFRGALPSTEDLEKLQQQSPGLFDSGYFVLAAIRAPERRPRAGLFAVNLDRGGNAGQIMVVRGRREHATHGAARRGPPVAGRRVRAATKTRPRSAARRGPRRLHERARRASPLVVVAVALGVALLLMVALRAMLVPLVAVALQPARRARHVRRDDAAVQRRRPAARRPGLPRPDVDRRHLRGRLRHDDRLQALLLARTRGPSS